MFDGHRSKGLSSTKLYKCSAFVRRTKFVRFEGSPGLKVIQVKNYLDVHTCHIPCRCNDTEIPIELILALADPKNNY